MDSTPIPASLVDPPTGASILAQAAVRSPSAPEPLEAFLRHTRCPEAIAARGHAPSPEGRRGFFRFEELVLFGHSHPLPAPRWTGQPAPQTAATIEDGIVQLPFNPTEVIENLHLERYVPALDRRASFVPGAIARELYYAFRPILPVAVRRYLQSMWLRRWQNIPFPQWPVDITIERLVERLWILLLRASGEPRLPFIWFWPRRHRASVIMTHDVETAQGQEFCSTMVELDREHGVRSSYQLVPEARYVISPDILGTIRDAGCEVCVHGDNHDHRLFEDERQFRRRAARINEHGRDLGARGFRAPILHRNSEWFDALAFEYDMSIPNVGHLEPQRGGCCTVFPYFIGNVLELPLTTAQDYTLFHLLRIEPHEIWRRQTDIILAHHGLVTFLVHPDYAIEPAYRAHYRRLLETIRARATHENLWLALPGEVNDWWRQRDKMRLVPVGDTWTIEGPGSENASVAYASLDGDRVRYTLDPLPE